MWWESVPDHLHFIVISQYNFTGLTDYSVLGTNIAWNENAAGCRDRSTPNLLHFPYISTIQKSRPAEPDDNKAMTLNTGPQLIYYVQVRPHWAIANMDAYQNKLHRS